MRKQSLLLLVMAISCLALLLSGCMEKFVEPTAKTENKMEELLPPYYGPKAKIAVAKFEWIVGEGGTKTTISSSMFGNISIKETPEQSGYAKALRDMLTTAMVQSKRFKMLERQNLDVLAKEIKLQQKGWTDKSGVKKGHFKGADLLIVAAVTGWEPGTSGGGGSLFGDYGRIFSSLKGSFKKSSLAMDIRIIDTKTSEILAATTVKGEARDINIGGALSVLTGGGSLGGNLDSFANTPMEKAIRTCIYQAVKFMAENTPKEYFKY